MRSLLSVTTAVGCAIMLMARDTVEGFSVVSVPSSSLGTNEISNTIKNKMFSSIGSDMNEQYHNDDGNYHHHDADTYRTVLKKAKELALFASKGSVVAAAEAKSYLNYILELQSDCILGTVTDAELCSINDDTNELYNIVTVLRQTIDDNTISATTDDASAAAILNNDDSRLGPLLLLSMFLLSSFAMGVIQNQWYHLNTVVEPFTIDEWMYAVKGGYLDTMISHYIRNGGI